MNATTKQKLNRLGSKLENAFNENPVLFMFATAAVFKASSALIDSVAGARSKNAYANKMNRSS